MLPTGKLDSGLLEKIIFKQIRYRRPEVLVRPGVGEDCAVVDFAPFACVLSTDPVTAASAEVGRLAVHVSCNDVASSGVAPLGVMLSVLLPEGTEEAEAEKIMRQAAETAAELEVEIIGGHTEITSSVTKPVIVSTAIGRGILGAADFAKDIRPGDSILVTKQVAMEGSGIIARERADALRGALTPEELEEAAGMLDRISVVKEGLAAGRAGAAAMHDITEGGVLGAVWELCEISKTGAEIHEEKIPASETTKKICRHLGLDYLRLISSGSMMIISRPEKKEKIFAALKEVNVPVACIGVMKERKEGIYMLSDEERREIGPPGADEIYSVKD